MRNHCLNQITSSKFCLVRSLLGSSAVTRLEAPTAEGRSETLVRKNGRKFLQITYLTRNMHLEHIKNIYNSIIKTTLVLKWAKDQNRYFSREDIQMTKRHMESCWALLVIKEMRRRYHSIPTRMFTIRKKDIKCWWVKGEIKHLFIAGRNVKWYNCFEKNLAVPQKIKHGIITWLSNCIPKYIPKRNKHVMFTQKLVHK